jgi:hypothetical protein
MKFVVRDLGFWESDFEGHPEGQPGYEPAHHLTLKLEDGRSLRDAFRQIVAAASAAEGALRGYIEAELVAFDEKIDARPFDRKVHPPFLIERSNLPLGTFRESELHITLDRDASSPELVRALHGMGLFSAYLRKSYGNAQVFTVQGSRKGIAGIAPQLLSYLRRAGGAVECTVKEERIVGWWCSCPEIALPPVMRRVNWFSA